MKYRRLVLRSTSFFALASICSRGMWGATPDIDWWKHAVIYEVYPRSFGDSNGDG
ncbi:MAG: hypothetical protein JO091_05450, partial [Acidobacteriaceae bacterium]|nr:hypothetical protein [Acidobacteriaceae bacterium]